MSGCPKLADPTDGLVTIDNQDWIILDTYETSVGTDVKVACYQPSAFLLQGPSRLTCQGDNTWSNAPPLPKCISKPTTLSPIRDTAETVISTNSDNTVILAVVGAILCCLLLAVIIILTYLLCKWRNKKAVQVKRILYDDSEISSPRYDIPSTSFHNYGKTSVFGTHTDLSQTGKGRGHSRRGSDISGRTASTTFTRHSLVVLPKPAYSQHYGPFWYYPIPDDQNMEGSAMRSVMDYHNDLNSGVEPNPLYDPEIDYLQYPQEATAIDTMGRPVHYRPHILVGSEHGTVRTARSHRSEREGRSRNGESRHDDGSARDDRSARGDDGETHEKRASSDVEFQVVNT